MQDVITINLFWKEELDWPDFLVKAGACHICHSRDFFPPSQSVVCLAPELQTIQYY